jgi:hypothetical protein
MEKKYRNLAILFGLILVIIFIGFYKTYFGLILEFKTVSSAAHFHAITLMIWSVLIIAQPLLIRYKKIAIHKLIGKISYILVPLIVYSTIALTRSRFFEKQGHVPDEENLADLFLPFTHIFLFAVFYLLAIINKKPSYVHMRYMIMASFVVLAPAIVRIDFSFTGLKLNSLIVSYIFTDLCIAILIVYDMINKKIYKPYFIALVLFMIVHFTSFYVPDSNGWQKFSAWIATTLF